MAFTGPRQDTHVLTKRELAAELRKYREREAKRKKAEDKETKTRRKSGRKGMQNIRIVKRRADDRADSYDYGGEDYLPPRDRPF